MKIFIRGTNPCVMRKVDIARYREALKLAGHEIVASSKDADCIMVWTCSFRKDFRDNSIATLQQYEKTGKQVIALGCLPSIEPDHLNAHFSGESIPWKNEADPFQTLFGADVTNAPFPVVERPLDIPAEEFNKQNNGVRAAYCDQFIKLFISEGCPLKCSYCAEIQAFPEYRDFPLDRIVEKYREMSQKTGHKKVMLWSDCTGEYGRTNGSSFPELLQALSQVVQGAKIGIQNLHPLYWLKYREEIQHHIEAGNIWLLTSPIQSACDRILQLMERPYTSEDLCLLFGSVKGLKDIEIETHIIAGFPSEIWEEWQQTVDFICEHKPKYVLGSGFLSAPGIPASILPDQISFEEKRRRILDGVEQMKRAGVICNHDMGTMNTERRNTVLIDQLEL